MKIKLFTRDGGFVRDAEIPPFVLMPEVMLWGSRIFVRNIFMDTTGWYGYAEACGWSLDMNDITRGNPDDYGLPETRTVGAEND